MEQLNAFVDGELDLQGRAEVTARAAADPAYARELAALMRLKATLGNAVPARPIDLTPDAPPAPAAPRGHRRATGAIAAGILLLAALAAGWFAHESRPQQSSQIALDWLIEAHRAWTAQKPGDPDAVAAQAVSAALDPAIPDLSVNGLDIVYSGERRVPGREKALVTGYRGSRGCRLTLFVHRPGKVSLAEPVTLETGAVRASIWRAGALQYALIAEGMAPRRFRLIAESVRRSSLEHRPLDRKTRTALAHSRAASPPCRA